MMRSKFSRAAVGLSSVGLAMATIVVEVAEVAAGPTGFGTIIIVKETHGGDDSFDFEWGDAAFDPFTLVTDDGVSPQHIEQDVPDGFYSLTEVNIPEGFFLYDVECSDGSGLDGPLYINLDVDETVTCTFINHTFDYRSPDLALSKSVDDPTPDAGDDVVYTLTITNVVDPDFNNQQMFRSQGASQAFADEVVSVTDELPAPLLWSTIPSNCTGTGTALLECEVPAPDLDDPNDVVTIVATATIPADAASGPYVNTATIDSSFDPICPMVEGVRGSAQPQGVVGCDPEPVCELSDPPTFIYDGFAEPGNNIACAEIVVSRDATITLTKTDDTSGALAPGGTFKYTLQVGNDGPSSIFAGADLIDDLPVGLQLVSVTPSGNWDCNNVDPISCEFDQSLAAGSSAPPIVVTVTLDANYASGTVTNSATVEGIFDSLPILTANVTSRFRAVGDPFTTSATAIKVTAVNLPPPPTTTTTIPPTTTTIPPTTTTIAATTTIAVTTTVAPTTTTIAPTTTAAAAIPPPPPTVPEGDVLPTTGADGTSAMTFALGALLLGCGLIAVARRRSLTPPRR